jgi:hypothetical protein
MLEKDALKIVQDAVKDVDGTANVFVMKREPHKDNPYVYWAIFGILTRENNHALVEKLVFLEDFEFAGSNIDVDKGTIQDILMVQCLIMPNKC